MSASSTPVDFSILLADSYAAECVIPQSTPCERRVKFVKRHLLSRSILRSFFEGLSISLVVQMSLGVICTFICQEEGLQFDCQMSLFVAPVVFPLAFSINACYQRREKALDDLGMFKGAAVIIYYCHRDWARSAGFETNHFLERSVQLLRQLTHLIKFYLLIEKAPNRTRLLKHINHCFSALALVNEDLRGSQLPASGPLCTRLIHSHNQMCWSFERLRVVREYRTPRTIRAFTKVFIFAMPLLLSPYYVYLGEKVDSPWVAYYISMLVSFAFGSLQAVQDNLDDPFDGIGEDDINLELLDDWAGRSLAARRHSRRPSYQEAVHPSLMSQSEQMNQIDTTSSNATAQTGVSFLPVSAADQLLTTSQTSTHCLLSMDRMLSADQLASPHPATSAPAVAAPISSSFVDGHAVAAIDSQLQQLKGSGSLASTPMPSTFMGHLDDAAASSIARPELHWSGVAHVQQQQSQVAGEVFSSPMSSPLLPPSQAVNLTHGTAMVPSSNFTTSL